jgi:exodeoxyribonuclease VII small subunit
MAKEQPSYNQLKNELNEVIVKLQSDDLDVEEALELYKKGQTLIEQLEKYLEKAENTVKELKAKFDS